MVELVQTLHKHPGSQNESNQERNTQGSKQVRQSRDRTTTVPKGAYT